MINIVEGDLFCARTGAIVHQVNCQGVMGSGVAKKFKEVFPKTYKYYLEYVKTNNKHGDSSLMLGDLIWTKENNFFAVCLFAQDHFGKDGKRYTNYKAFREGCKQLARVFPKTMMINMPYGIGCGLGGGNWDEIEKIINEELKDHVVILWKIK